MARPDWSYLVHIFSLGMGGCFVITPLKPYLIVSLPVGHMAANNIHVAYFSQQREVLQNHFAKIVINGSGMYITPTANILNINVSFMYFINVCWEK